MINYGKSHEIKITKLWNNHQVNIIEIYYVQD